jgi:small subunit ribosomal protein S13
MVCIEKGYMAEKTTEKKQEQIIRFVDTNLDGRKPVEIAIRKVAGVSFMFSNAIVNVCNLKNKKLGELSEKELKVLEDAVIHPEKFNIPSWMFNRKKEPTTGKDKHLTASQLELTKKMDINVLKKIKCYRGVRHILGLPVRGQRTRSSFRKGTSVGVKKKKAQPTKAKE